MNCDGGIITTDRAAAPTSDGPSVARAADRSPDLVRTWPLLVLALPAAAQDARVIEGLGPVVPVPGPDGQAITDRSGGEGAPTGGAEDWAVRLAEARAVAEVLAAAGKRVSRRTLRSAGLRGSNSELGELARLVRVGARGSGPGIVT